MLFLVFLVKPHVSLFFSFRSSFWVRLTNNLTCYINVWFKSAFSFFRVLLFVKFSFFNLLFTKDLLSFKEILIVTIKHIRFLWNISRSLWDLRMKRVLFVKLLIYTFIISHSFLYSLSSIFIKSVNNISLHILTLFCSFYLSNFRWFCIHSGLESQILLFLFLLHSKFLKFFIFFFLKFANSLINRSLIVKFVHVTGGVWNCHQFRFKAAILHQFLVHFSFQFISIFFSFIGFVKQSFLKWYFLIFLSFIHHVIVGYLRFKWTSFLMFFYLLLGFYSFPFLLLDCLWFC